MTGLRRGASARDVASAIFLELLPLELPIVGAGAIVALFVVDPPRSVVQALATPIFFCFLAFGLSGIGWFQFGYRTEGCLIFIGRGVVSLGLAFFLLKTIGEFDCGRACGDYSTPIITLFWPSILLPIASTVVLVVRLLGRPARPS